LRCADLTHREYHEPGREESVDGRDQSIPVSQAAFVRVSKGVFVHAVGHNPGEVEAYCFVQSCASSLFHLCVGRRLGRWTLHCRFQLEGAFFRHRGLKLVCDQESTSLDVDGTVIRLILVEAVRGRSLSRPPSLMIRVGGEAEVTQPGQGYAA
jgi:hypothetical protein